MELQADRWEHGSHSHELADEGVPSFPWRTGDVRLHGTGRHSLAALLAYARPARVFAPRYYCPEVFETIRQGKVDLVYYNDMPTAPLRPPPGLRDGDAWLRCNTLGLRGEYPAEAVPAGVILIDDHSHDLLSNWALAEEPHYAFASLRKTLPLADGGALWSPRGLDLPTEAALTARHAHAVRERLRAMELKARYLAGDAVAPEEFRRPLVRSEAELGHGDVSAISPESAARLVRCPTVHWRARRARNFAVLHAAIPTAPVKVLLPDQGAVPFVLTLVAEDEAQRERLRHALIAQRVYPAILWSLDVAEIGTEAASLGASVLCIQIDQRYDDADMEQVGAVLREVLAA